MNDEEVVKQYAKQLRKEYTNSTDVDAQHILHVLDLFEALPKRKMKNKFPWLFVVFAVIAIILCVAALLLILFYGPQLLKTWLR